MTHYKNNSEDFIVRVRPILDRKDEWTGEIDVVIITAPNNPLSDDDYYQLMHICKMISSVVPLVEKDENIRNKINDYVVNTLDKKAKANAELTQVNDNVIRVNFRPETKH